MDRACVRVGTLFGVVALFGVAHADGTQGQVPIERFMQVTPDIYRGARPDAGGLQALKGLGIKTDLDLEDDDGAVADESQAAAQLGLSFVSEPMSGFLAPSDGTVDAVFGVLGDSTAYPIYVHCEHGEDRTGLIIGLYRVFDQGWTPKAAYREMLADGFHPLLVGLNAYFDEKTGYPGF